MNRRRVQDSLGYIIQLCVCAAALLVPQTSFAQHWRTDAAHLGTSTRVLIVGTRPDDEDNALTVWLRRGQHIETAFLSLTRGETGRNVSGAERNAPLAVVRTAELLAERERDGARQFFTRAFDVGVTTNAGLVARAWPRDSLLIDVVSIIRAFRPHVIIALNDTTKEDDASRRYAAALLASAYAVAADTALMPARITARLPAWNAARLYTRVEKLADSTRDAARINVGAFDRESGRSFAELGSEIGRLQRTQGASPGAPLGSAVRLLRLDSTRVGHDATLFGNTDTTLTRLRAAVPAEVVAHFDSLLAGLSLLARDAVRLEPDSIAALLISITNATTAIRLELGCVDASTASTCDGVSGDLATVLATIHARAKDAFIGASGVVIDAVAEREQIAAGDSAAVTVTIYNGGARTLTLRRLALSAQTRLTVIHRDTSIDIPPAGLVRYTAQVRMLSATHHWWQIEGLVQGTLLQRVPRGTRGSVSAQMILGEDRISTSSVEMTLRSGTREVPIVAHPIVFRGPTALRGDMRHRLIGVPETSLLLDRSAEYERAGQSVDRLFRVYVGSARSTADTVAVTLQLPMGMVADSLTRTVALPPFAARNLFFRIRGAMAAGTHNILASARSVAAAPVRPSGSTLELPRVFTLGTVINEYPHIPAQHFVRFSNDRIESVDLKLPPRFRVGYMRGTEDLRSVFAQLRLSVQSLDLALIPVSDLSTLTAIIIGAGALRSETAMLAAPALRAFMERGGVVLVLPAGRELVRSGILPYAFEMQDASMLPAANYSDFILVDDASPFFRVPNRITVEQFEMWSGDRGCAQFGSYTSAYAAPLLMSTAARSAVQPALFTAPVGKGRIVFTPMCLAQQLEAAQPAAPKLLVNLLTNSVGAGGSPARGERSRP